MTVTATDLEGYSAARTFGMTVRFLTVTFDQDPIITGYVVNADGSKTGLAKVVTGYVSIPQLWQQVQVTISGM